MTLYEEDFRTLRLFDNYVQCALDRFRASGQYERVGPTVISLATTSTATGVGGSRCHH